MTEASVLQHFDRLADLLAVEREAEVEENRRQLERLPLPVRESLGKTVTRLTIDGLDQGMGGYPRVHLSRAPRGETLAPFHGMNQGDNVRLNFPEGTKPAFVDGTLDQADAYRCAVAVDARLPEELPSGKCSVDLLGSDATHRRMMKALQQAARSKQPEQARLRAVFHGLEPATIRSGEEFGWFNARLNQWQQDAVRGAMAADDVYLVHGPPGTGKTTVLVEIVRQAVARGLRVLATAPSNIAVDNMLEKLLDPEGGEPIRVVRLGHPARTLESLRHGTLRAQAAEDEQFLQVQEMDAWRERLQKKLAKQGRGALSGEERAVAKKEAQKMWRDARKLELQIARRLAASAQVVLSTHGGISQQYLRGGFDLIVLDEASQAPEPLSWIALLKGPKAVFAGDSCQLPPTLYSREAAEGGLAVTLFERLQKTLREDLQTMLRVQYRMHEAIMGFSSKKFYGGKLIADDAVKSHLADGLEGVAAGDLTSKPLVYVDTAGTGWEENLNELLQSRENEGEAALAVKIVNALLDAGMPAKSMAVLTPYMAQVKRLKSLLSVPGLEIGTVDGFQGREKEATVISLVRSNERGEVGFLTDVRRMNVAVTRARRLSIVIGDSVTISNHEFYRDFLDYVAERGEHRSAYEF
jgi:superfamily I DNA and/or RNA helicase